MFRQTRTEMTHTRMKEGQQQRESLEMKAS